MCVCISHICLTLNNRFQTKMGCWVSHSGGKRRLTIGRLAVGHRRGALAAVAITVLLLALGSGIGLSSVSPWSALSPSATTFTLLAAVWLIVVQWLLSALGGYISGRLRTKWAGHCILRAIAPTAAIYASALQSPTMCSTPTQGAAPATAADADDLSGPVLLAHPTRLRAAHSFHAAATPSSGAGARPQMLTVIVSGHAIGTRLRPSELGSHGLGPAASEGEASNWYQARSVGRHDAVGAWHAASAVAPYNKQPRRSSARSRPLTSCASAFSSSARPYRRHADPEAGSITGRGNFPL